MKRALLLIGLAACATKEPYDGAFEEPSVVAIVQPEVGGPFEDPIGYVANGHGGRIVPIDVKLIRFLTDDPHGSFLRSAPLATGASRRLVSLATWAPDAETVHLFAGDVRFGHLLRVPHVVGVGEDGFPVEAEAAVVGEAVFVGTGDASMSEVRVRTGYSTTETWTASFDGARWWITGSRSGKQESVAITDVPYVADDGAVEFTIRGAAASGDRLELAVDAGVVEYDVGGVPLELAMRPDQSLLAAIVADANGGSRVVWVEPDDGAVIAGPALPPSSEPRRMTWSADGLTLWVADGGAPAAWAMRPDDGTAVEHVLPWPITDVAVLDGDAGTLLYVTPSGMTEVWLDAIGATPADDRLIDVNAWVPGVQGMRLVGPISGIEAVPLAYRFQDEVDGERRLGRSVAIAMVSGRVQFAEEGTGCLTSDGDGPRTALTSSGSQGDFKTNIDADALGPRLAVNGDGYRHAIVNPCGGVARKETWAVTFDAALQGWVVEGGFAGVQPSLALENQRYVSDDGAVSFLIESGATPSQDGWKFTFEVDPGVIDADGSNGGTGDRAVALDLPSDPVFFHHLAGPRGSDRVEDRAYVLVAGQASDSVERVAPTDGKLDGDWR